MIISIGAKPHRIYSAFLIPAPSARPRVAWAALPARARPTCSITIFEGRCDFCECWTGRFTINRAAADADIARAARGVIISLMAKGDASAVKSFIAALCG